MFPFLKEMMGKVQKTDRDIIENQNGFCLMKACLFEINKDPTDV